MKRFSIAIALLALAGVAFAQSPIKVSFWYSVGGAVKDTIETRIKEYNASQSKYQIEGVFAGSYEESVQKVIAAVVAGAADPAVCPFSVEADNEDAIAAGEWDKITALAQEYGKVVG